MMNSTSVRAAVYRAILRHKGDVFQTVTIREELKWDEESPEAKRLHAIIQSLKQDGVIKTTGIPRKRHQYLMLEKPEEVQLRLGRIRSKAAAGNGKVEQDEKGPPAKKSGPQRVRYLEERLDELEERAARQDQDSSQILELLMEMNTKLDDLHREWVETA
jgi:hypothetical protein